MERAKFYSVEDLGNGMQLSRAQIVLDGYVTERAYTDINDVLELYNVKLLLDNNLALKSWTSDDIKHYNKIAANFGKDIVTFYRNPESNLDVSSADFQYQQDYWDVYEKFGLLDLLTEDFVRNVIISQPNQIENILRCERIVKKFDGLLSELLQRYPLSAPLLVNAYYVTNLVHKERNLNIPSSLSIGQKEKIINDYLDGPNKSIGIVRVIMQSQDTDGLKLCAKTRVKARRTESELAKISEASITSAIQTGFSIKFINDENLPAKQESLEGLCLLYIYNESYLDRLNDTQLVDAFYSLFGYLDRNGFLTLCYNWNEDNIFERMETQEVRGIYRMNSMFRMKNNIAVSQVALFDYYLRRRGKRMEDLIKSYFEKHFKADYGFPCLPLSMPNDDDSYANKNKIIAPEMEAVINQFNLFVEEGEIDPELYERSNPLPITLAKSLLYQKHKYVVICDGPNDIYMPMFYLFSDQQLLGFVDPYKDNHYSTLFNLLCDVDSVNYNNYEDFQKPKIDYLVQNGYLNKENGLLTFGNIPRITALKLLYEKREISYYHCDPEVRKEIDLMVKNGWLKYDEFLLSPQERHYVNFFLNNSEFSNGYQLRNKYSHGRLSCTQSEADQKNAYYYFLMIFVVLLLKMDEDMRMSIYLNEQIEKQGGL